MHRLDASRILRWYLPTWLVATLFGITLSALHVAQAVAATAVLWSGLFAGSVVALTLFVVADEQDVECTERRRAPGRPARSAGLVADLLPRRRQPLAVFREPVESVEPVERPRSATRSRMPTS